MNENQKSHHARAPTLSRRPTGGRLASLVAGGSLAVLLAVALSATTASAQTAAPGGLPACISVTPYARYIPYGYNHFVVLKNGCAKAATCTVTTDVNPQATTAEVPPGAAVDLLTYRASPAEVFVAHATCKLHP